MKLEQLTSDKLRKGMLVVCFEVPATVRVGRIQSEVKTYPLQQALLTGLFAEFDLLYADEHAQAEDLVWKKYFYWSAEAPTGSGVFKWPAELMKLRFKLAESSLKMGRKGWIVPIEVRPHLGPTIVIE